ncbi:M50 family metallopeptidase [candidate division KSB1 bacterium]|nr:M50 family metallopeptidase [candidate division KSB1 bacterium]
MKTIISILLIPFVISYFASSVQVFTHLPYYWDKIDFFVFGILLYSLIYMIFFRKSIAPFWFIFSHELTHLLFAILMFRRPQTFIVESNMGGFIGFRPGGNFLITLAPYFFPTFTFILLLLKPAVNRWYYEYYLFILGFTYAFHAWMFLKHSRPWQQDFHDAGIFFSFVFVLLMNIVMTTIIFIVLMENWSMAWLYLKEGVTNLYLIIRTDPVPLPR